jgi:hypothetical protein
MCILLTFLYLKLTGSHLHYHHTLTAYLFSSESPYIFGKIDSVSAFSNPLSEKYCVPAIEGLRDRTRSDALFELFHPAPVTLVYSFLKQLYQLLSCGKKKD